MKVTFMMKLAVSIVNELSAKDFKISYTDVIENKINALTFHKDGYDFKIAIFTERKDRIDYLKIIGSVDKQLWCITGAQLEPLLDKLRYGDKITIQGEGNDKFAKYSHEYDIEYNTSNIDKSAVAAIAKDIVGDIINPTNLI
jgi:hypothetical protein